MKRPANNIWSVVIKVVILALLCWALYEQLISQRRLDDVVREFRSGVAENGWNLVLVCILLMFANWGVEAFKWNLLINKLVHIRFRRAFQAVWTGVTLGYSPQIGLVSTEDASCIFLPGFVSQGGQFTGRKLCHYPGYLICRYYCLNGISSPTGFAWRAFLYHHCFLSVILLALLTLAYYYLYLVVDLLRNRRIMRRLVRYIEVLSFYSPADFTRIFLLSLLRYSVFSAQYLIYYGCLEFIYRLEKVDGGQCNILAQTALPSFTVAELFTRGNISLYFLRYYTDNTGAILAASTSLWLLNLIFPAVAGYFFILRKNFFKTRNQ